MKVTCPTTPPGRDDSTSAPRAPGAAWAKGILATIAGGVAACGAAILVAGCTPRTEPASRPDLFTGRSTRQKDIVAIVELRQPAALARFPQARRRGAFPALTRHLESLRAEQDAFLAELAALSPEVKLLGRSLFVANAVFVALPASLRDRIEGFPGVAIVESAGAFARPSNRVSAPWTLARASGFATEARRAAVRTGRALAFVGADAFHAQGHEGEGVRIGVIDTGVDYTHAALGGAGDAAAYASNDPAVIEPGTFPNAKVTGGVDLVGGAFDALSPDSAAHLPVPDPDPLDEGFHGTLVAAIAAGIAVPEQGFGGGVAPRATIYAIKVFGRTGGTNDAVILAALEHSADPDGDGDPRDALDVLNLSFNSRYGTPSHVFSKAVRSLARAGVAVVASGGNDGAEPFVIGAPATAEDSIAVGASVDDAPENWRFRAVEFTWPGEPDGLVVEAVEGVTTRPLSDLPDGPPFALVDVGVGDRAAFDAAMAAGGLLGRVVLCDRGGLSLGEKLGRAQAAGARGLVVVDVIDDDPFRMGGDGAFGIPGVMIGKEAGVRIREALARGAVSVDLTPARTFDDPGLVDVVAAFSSRGPRAQDGFAKPDIVAPGVNVLSASAGSGRAFRYSSGTSMAAPHVAGAVALLLSSGVAHDARAAKAALLAAAVPLRAAGEQPVSPHLDAPSTQGAGRLRLDPLLSYPPRFEPSTVTLATDPSEAPGVGQAFEVVVSNPGVHDVMLSFHPEGAHGVTIASPEPVVIPAGTKRAVTFTATLDAAPSNETSAPSPGASKSPSQSGRPTAAPFAFVSAFNEAGVRIAGFPVAFPPRGPSGARVEVRRPSEGGTPGFEFSNAGASEAMVFPYARWLEDPREERLSGIFARARSHGACDLRGVSLRVLETGLLQAAFVLDEAVSTFALCEPSLLLDVEGDGVRDFEVTAAKDSALLPATFEFLGPLFSFLLDTRQVREIRARFDAGWTPSSGAAPNYADAIVDRQDAASFTPGRVIVLSADLAKVTFSKEARISALLRNATEPVARAIDPLDGAPVRKEPADGDALPWHVFDPAALALPKSLGDVHIPAGGEVRWDAGIALPTGLVFVVPSNEASRIVLRSR